MITNIWRYSHFLLAAISSIFILIAALTGFVLAFEPIDQKLQSVESVKNKDLTLGDIVSTVKQRYETVSEIQIDHNDHVRVAIISDEESEDGTFYMSPKSGDILFRVPGKRPIFAFATNLHRSLFLKSTGRLIIGITAFLLLLIACSGIVLIAKRQLGFRHFFKRIVKEDFYRDYHLYFGRLQLIPIIIIAVTGVYLSLYRFSIINEPSSDIIELSIDENKPTLAVTDFPSFQETKLSDVRLLEFPFSEDEEDYFTLTTKKGRFAIHQYNGQIIEKESFHSIKSITDWNVWLHTGLGSITWSIVLALAALGILFFLYSGAIISYRRLAGRVKNKYTSSKANYVILYGSENGRTKKMAIALFKSLIDAGKKVYINQLNKAKTYPQMQELVVLTSTYGDGEAPQNATNFLDLLPQLAREQTFGYSVVGFGSLAYSKYCQYAQDVQSALSALPDLQETIPLHKINNASATDFIQWSKQWAEKCQVPIEAPKIVHKIPKLKSFVVVKKQVANTAYGETFTLVIKPSKKMTITSGDLLGFYPKEDEIERLYSVGKNDLNHIVLSVKRHEFGICSNWLFNLTPGDTIGGKYHVNKDFRLPSRTKTVIMIANGTGIAPFLGMIQNTTHKGIKKLYWGGRTKANYELYDDHITSALDKGSLHDFQHILSKEPAGTKGYVQDLIEADIKTIHQDLIDGANLLICGSIAMQQGVFHVLDHYWQDFPKYSTNHYQQTGQIRLDCY